MPHILQKTITETFLKRVQETPAAIGFQYKPTFSEDGGVGQWKEVTFRAFYQECRLVSFGLMGLGIHPQDKVVIVSHTRFEWSLCDMAVLGASAITVPIYPSMTSEDIVYIAHHSEARVLILENRVQLKKILEKRQERPECLPNVEKIIVIEPSAMTLGAVNIEAVRDVMTLQALKELGRREEARDPSRFDRHLSMAQAGDLLTICYTSGTTGTPKGVMVTHDNLMSVLEDCVTVVGDRIDGQTDVILSFLPFSHIFGKVESLAVYTFGWKQVFAESLDRLVQNMEVIRPTLLFSVPRIFEKAFLEIHANLDGSPLAARVLFEWAQQVGRRYFEAMSRKSSPTLKNRLEYEFARRTVLSRIVKRFGGRLRFVLCGGAPLSREIGEFFQILGIPILEGYGLTETCAPVCLNRPDEIRFGTVGKPLPEVTLKIADDGEILVKSRKVFRAYLKLEEESSRVLEKGWFHTEDIGYLDSEGFLHITDRKKDIIVTSSGKNIAPQKIENLAKVQKLITQFVVHGDQRHYLTALITLNSEQVIRYAQEHQILFSEYAELIKNPKILTLAQKKVDEVNKRLASFEMVKKFVILPNEFTVEGGELTPSLKVRRNFINKRYKVELDSMYGESARVPLDSAQDIR